MESTKADLMAIQRLDDLTVVRFNWQGAPASTDLTMVKPLWDFFEQEKREPSKVVALYSAPELVGTTSLEMLSSGGGVKQARNGDWVTGPLVHQHMVREENVLRRFVEGIREIPAFVVGVAQGDMALRRMAPYLACDYRIATEDTTFVNTIRRMPVAPTGGMPWLLTRLVGAARTLQILLDETELSALEARDLGLVNFLTSPDTLVEESLAVARGIAEIPHAALVTIKRTTEASSEDFETYLDREADLVSRLSAPA